MQQQIPDNNGVVKDEISLKEVILSIQEWWKYILGKWKVIALCIIVGSILGLIYSLITPRIYQAETSFVLENAKSDGGVSSIAARLGFGSSNASSGLFGDEDNIITFLKSRTMIAQTLLSSVDINGKKELLIDRYIKSINHKKINQAIRENHIQFSEYPNANTIHAEGVVSAARTLLLKNNLSILKPDKDGNIVNVITKSEDEQFAKAFNDNLIKNATIFYMQTKLKRSIENVNILQHQTDSVKQLLNLAISGAAINSDEVPNLNPAYQRLKVPTQKRFVDVEMNKAILTQLVANLELAKIDLRKQSPLVQIIDSPVFPLDVIKTGKGKGIALGGIILGFLTVSILTVVYYLRRVLSQTS